MNEHEARQIIQQYGLRLHRKRETHEWRVFPPYPGDNERMEREAYYTSDLEDAISTALAMSKERGWIYNCRECKQQFGQHNFDGVTRERLIKNQLCFNCDFWQEKVLWKLNHDDAVSRGAPLSKLELEIAIINGVHYVIHDKVANPGWIHGYGGRLFRVHWFDGRAKESNNVWCQGRIPDHFRERLPDTAEFLDPYEKPKCTCGVRTPPPGMVARHADDCPARDEEKP